MKRASRLMRIETRSRRRTRVADLLETFDESPTDVVQGRREEVLLGERIAHPLHLAREVGARREREPSRSAGGVELPFEDDASGVPRELETRRGRRRRGRSDEAAKRGNGIGARVARVVAAGTALRRELDAVLRRLAFGDPAPSMAACARRGRARVEATARIAKAIRNRGARGV